MDQLPIVKVKYETVRTAALLDLLKATNLGREYAFGHVELPKKLKHLYSLFGRSMNDATNSQNKFSIKGTSGQWDN